MFPQRPRPGESEEELLEAQNRFHGRKRSKFAESREAKAGTIPTKEEKETFSSSSKNAFPLIQTLVRERDVSGALLSPPSESSSGNDPFPAVFKVANEAFGSSKNKKMSIFAQTFKKVSSSPHNPPSICPFTQSSHQRDFGSKSTLLSDSKVFKDEINQNIHEENVSKLSAMSEEDILAEQKRILESLDPKIMSFLKTKSSKLPKETNKSVEGVSSVECITKEDHLEVEKRKWMTDIPKGEEGKEDSTSNPVGLPARFDFQGEIMEGSRDEDLNAGLHHHGEEPHRAGYTLDELLTLSRSTFPQQKILALETLGHVVRNFKRGAFDGVFEVNILDSLLKTGILEILRMGMDEKSESIIFPSASTLAEFLSNDLDELGLDVTFNHYQGALQPSLPTEVSRSGSKAHAEYESEKKELKDAEIIQLDTVLALLRMDILDRIAYLISHMNPGVGVTLACLKILLRIARHSKIAARGILHHPRLLKEIAKSFLPSLSKSYSSKGSPIHLALKLIRVIVSWDKSYALSIISIHNGIGDALMSYIAYDPTSLQHEEQAKIPTNEGLTLVLESFRFWEVLLRYNLGTQYYLDFYPILLRQLLYYANKVDITDATSSKKYVYDHGTALIQVLGASILCLGQSNCLNLTHFKEMFVLLETCVKKWSVQIIGLDWMDARPSSKMAISNLLASAMRTLADFYFKLSEQKDFSVVDLIDKHIRPYAKCTLTPLFVSPFFQALLSSSIKRSSLNLTSETNVESGKNRDPKNLPSFGSVVYRGSVVPSIGEGSPFNLLVSMLYSLLLCKEIDKSLRPPEALVSSLNEKETSLTELLHKSKKSGLNSNWFTRIEAYYWSLLSLLLVRFKIPSLCLRPLGNLAISFLHSWDEELALELFSKVVFNEDLLTSTKMERLNLGDSQEYQKSLDDLKTLYLKHLFPSKSSLQRSASFFSSNGGLQGLTVSNAGELLLPWDWRFLPLLSIHNSRPDTEAPASTKEISEVRLCLEWLSMNNDDDEKENACGGDPFPSVTFTRLCTLFLATPDLFLDPQIQASTQSLFRGLLRDWRDLDLSVEIPGNDDFTVLYGELLKQFSAVSYGDSLFGEFVTLPLAMKFPSKYRFALWSDHSTDLRIINLTQHSLPLKEFLSPIETDLNVLRVYFTCILEGQVSRTRNPFLYEIALHHICSVAQGEGELAQEFRSKISFDHPLYKEMFLST